MCSHACPRQPFTVTSPTHTPLGSGASRGSPGRRGPAARPRPATTALPAPAAPRRRPPPCREGPPAGRRGGSRRSVPPGAAPRPAPRRRAPSGAGGGHGGYRAPRRGEGPARPGPWPGLQPRSAGPGCGGLLMTPAAERTRQRGCRPPGPSRAGPGAAARRGLRGEGRGRGLLLPGFRSSPAGWWVSQLRCGISVAAFPGEGLSRAEEGRGEIGAALGTGRAGPFRAVTAAGAAGVLPSRVLNLRRDSTAGSSAGLVLFYRGHRRKTLSSAPTLQARCSGRSTRTI